MVKVVTDCFLVLLIAVGCIAVVACYCVVTGSLAKKRLYMKRARLTSASTMNPDSPVTPTVRSFPPFITMMAKPTVAFKEPWITAAAMTDFAFSRT